MNSTKLHIVKRDENTVRFRCKKGEQFMTFSEVFQSLNESEFVYTYVQGLINFDIPAFYWEHPALKTEYLNKPYECIIQRSGPLEKLPADESAFADYIHVNYPVVDFLNLGKNARLIVPAKLGESENYNHLGRFIRKADNKQIHALFQRIGITIFEELEAQETVWLSTAGLGVIWLHVRMDQRPKYYKTKPYKDVEFLSRIKG